MDLDQRLAVVAARQEATFTDDQALAIGFTRRMIRRRVIAGRWHRKHHAVLTLAGSPATWRQAVFAAWLAAGNDAVVSGLAAARIHGLVTGKPRPEITVPRHRRVRLNGADIHRATLLHEADIVETAGLRVTTPTKTVIDLCSKL